MMNFEDEGNGDNRGEVETSRMCCSGVTVILILYLVTQTDTCIIWDFFRKSLIAIVLRLFIITDEDEE